MSNKVEELYLGADIGNGYTKSGAVKFASRVKLKDFMSNLEIGKKSSSTHTVTMGDKSYTVGQGDIFTGPNRYFTENYKLCLLTAVALNFPNEDFIDATVCVGLPIEDFKALSAKVRETYEGTQHSINVDGKDYTIRFKQFAVFVEGAYPILVKNTGRVLTVDMGAGTINVIEFNGLVPGEYATYRDSMYKIYQKVASYLNVEKRASFEPMDIEPILNKTKTFINQVDTDITDIRPIIDANIQKVASQINNAFNMTKIEAIYGVGGGMMDTFNYWKKYIPNIQLAENAQNINSSLFNILAQKRAKELE